ncbi:hypothetical protein NQ317_018051, partial [Molorchus minor]
VSIKLKWQKKQAEQVQEIDYDYPRNDPSPPDLSRTLPKPKTTVFGVFPYIFKSKESIATIPEMIRALPTFTDFAQTLPKARNTVSKESIATIPEVIRALPTLSEFSRFCPNSTQGRKHRVRGIDCDYSRNDQSPPNLTQTLPKPKTTVFGVFPYIFRYRESIWTTPEATPEARALPKYE